MNASLDTPPEHEMRADLSLQRKYLYMALYLGGLAALLLHPVAKALDMNLLPKPRERRNKHSVDVEEIAVATLDEPMLDEPLVDEYQYAEPEPDSATTPWQVGSIDDHHIRIGQLLLESGLITQTQLENALRLQVSWGSRLGDVLLAMGWVKPYEFYQVLAKHLGLIFVNLQNEPADGELFERSEYSSYAEHLYLPWRRKDGVLWVVTANPTSPELEVRWGGRDDVRFVVTSRFDIVWELQRIAGAEFSDDAVFYLSNFAPDHSARTVVTPDQKLWIVGLLLSAFYAFAFDPVPTAIILNSILNVFLFFSFVFRTSLCWMSCSDKIGQTITDEEVEALNDEELPIYTVLVPMYKEPDVLPILAAALRNMDYPKSKLDIKLVLEENDDATINAAKALGLASIFEIVRVPHSMPKTKPKACNYALRMARGEFVTIYDAEDKPEPDQLKKVIVAFNRLGDRTACIQAHLNYFNSEENWLTRMFTLEYSLWFDMFLPALDHLRVPIPLGGTSNHFDLTKLREVGAWDPFNVTEDADLGLRFAAHGYHVGVVSSVTLEEANAHFGNWIRQRSRWIKGYIQTWLVNMRHPVRLFGQVGWKGFFSFQLFVGGTIVSALAYPFLVVPFILWILSHTSMLRPYFPAPLLLVSTINLIVGNSFLIYLSMLAATKRRHFALLPYALTVPGYWLMQSISGYKALWQLVTNPFYWEKTTHGISKSTSAELAHAAESTPE
jgi:cellulose synthase/poly-beta-1,6-N-acetylglucosamine synthase-like glycosyltransferase